MSAQLDAAAKEARKGNLDLNKQVRHIGNVFMPPASKKFGRHIGLGLSVRPSVSVLHLHSVKNR